MTTKTRLAVLAIICIVLSEILFAQVSTGLPAFGSFSATPAGTINLGNLNLHLSVPIVQKQGRGTNFSYALTYDSSVWYPVTANGTTTWSPVPAWGWTAGTQIVTGSITYSTARTTGGTCYYDGTKYTEVTYTYSNFVFTDGSGGRHTFGSAAVATDVFCSGDNDTFNGFSIGTLDGSGIVLDTTGGLPGIARIPSGNILNSGTGVATDTNGNEISYASGVFTDTLGTTVLTVSGLGTPASPNLFQYTAPGGTATAKLIYTSYSVKTGFGCSGVSEYSITQQNLVSEILLADGTSYTFTYEPTPGGSGTVTGRVASVTLPTGGVESITYAGSGTGISNGIVCADGSTSGMTIQTPDGTTSYVRSGSGSAWTTTVTDPQSNKTAISFEEASNNFYETQRLSYQGSSPLLLTSNVCYNGDTSAPSCTTDAITLPILNKSVYTGLPSLSGKQSLEKVAYNSYGLLTSDYSYDYGAGIPGVLLRSQTISYAPLSGIVDHPQTVSIYDGSGNLAAQTTYTYDGGSVTATSGTPSHASVSGSRGNATTVSQWVSSSSSLSSTYTYFDTGLIQTATDVNGGQTSYTYGACGNSFPTQIKGATGLTIQETWSCPGGVVLTATDANNNVTTASYTDPNFWRPASVTDAAGNTTSYTYHDPTSVESVLTFNGGNSTTDALATVDSLGRNLVSQIRQSPVDSSFDSVSYTYDGDGRLTKVSLPYTGSAGGTNSSGPGTTTVFDALNRKSSVSDSGGMLKSYTYNQNDKLVTLTPAPTGERAKSRQHEYDALGRLTSVCEVTSSLSGNGTCGQTNSLTGYWTKYTYNAMGKIIGVLQNAQSSGSQQTRSYSYDGLGRLISETNPESSATTYVYDSDSTCGTSSGDLVKKTDALGNVTCTAYDVLHRSTQVTYPSGPYASSTKAKYYVYDSATVNGTPMANAAGNLAEAYTGSPSSKVTDLAFSYSVRGEITDVYEMTPNSGGYFHVNERYWANGVLNTLAATLGTSSLFPTITYGVDGEGRPYSASASSGQNPLSQTTYNPASQVTSMNYGSLDTDAFGFDANTYRPTSYRFNINGSAVSGALTWNPNGSLGSLAITNPLNSADTQNCNYSNDDLQHTASVSCTGSNAWSQTFSYDAFGNISKSGSSSFGAGYSSATNRISEFINAAYDTTGNLTSITSDYAHQYSWDADGNQTWVDGISVTFDALDRAVEKLASGAYTQILYSTSGTKLALVSRGSLVEAFVPLPGNATAVYNSSGLDYRHPDWLGSSRLGSTSLRAMYYSGSYAPFGESYSETGTHDRSFSGENQDTEVGQYDFLYRNYSSVQGRWISPDPAGLGAVWSGNPQTWNRYAYVINQPLKYTDALGLNLGCDALNPCPPDMDDEGGGGVGTTSILTIYLPGRQSNGGGGGGGSSNSPPCLTGSGPLAVGQSRCSPNNTQPSVPKPQDPILKYAKCASNVRSQATSNRKTVSIIQQVSYGNALGACGFTGPDAPFCIGVVSALNGTVSAVNWGAYLNAVWTGEGSCLQQ
jgi:RHS repeat-associated protein